MFSEEQDRELLREHLYMRPDPLMSFGKLPVPHNVVGRTDLCAHIDQHKVMRLYKNVEFPKKNFPALTIRFRPPRGSTFLVFSTGQTVGCGTDSDDALAFGFQKMRQSFNKNGFRCSLMPINIENRVYSFKLATPIQISEFEYEDGFGSIWAPNVFPGLVYKMFDPPISVLVFESGSLMMTGVKREEHLTLALSHLIPILQRHPHLTYNPDQTRKSTIRTLDRTTRARGMKILQKMNSMRGTIPISQLRREFEAELAALEKQEKEAAEKAAAEEAANGGAEAGGKKGKKRKPAGTGAMDKRRKKAAAAAASAAAAVTASPTAEEEREGLTGMTEEEVIRREVEMEHARMLREKHRREEQTRMDAVNRDMPDPFDFNSFPTPVANVALDWDAWGGAQQSKK
jgi:transcription initiation factor TFIID TATA-box-binding protein